MLYALLFGIAFNFLGDEAKCAAGVRFASRRILQIGVALLGAAITIGQAAALGGGVLAIVILGVVGTLLGGYAIGRAVGLKADHATLSAGAVAICGASAAMAIAAVLPATRESERNLTLTVAGVTALSTLAMVLYPSFAQAMGLEGASAGVLLGAAIHDVAQAVGAGYILSDETGAIAAVVKLVRVAMLAPVVFVVSLAFRRAAAGGGEKRALLPLFVIGFFVVAAANSFGVLPPAVFASLAEISKACLVVAVAALGMRTSLRDAVAAGPAPMAAMIAQTLLLFTIVALGLALLSPAQG